jgi:tRNA (cytidine32/uridine32-2'-O)-methyltransferase
MDLARVEVVLVRPARAANVAAACRALKNMGLGRLRLVDSPRVDDAAARALAYGAWDVLDAARPLPDLRSAVAGCSFVAGTSARALEGAWTPRELAARAEQRAGGGRIALVFGPEASGLRNDELALCDARVHIPADAAQPSLNLAQAVLILAYELRLAALSTAAASSAAREPARATSGELTGAFDALREALLAIGYLNPDNPDAILSELRGLVSRASPTPRETSLLRGMARQMLWIARRPRPSG